MCNIIEFDYSKLLLAFNIIKNRFLNNRTNSQILGQDSFPIQLIDNVYLNNLFDIR